MGRDDNTPEWVQHIAFEVDDFNAPTRAKAHIENEDVDGIGPTNYGIFQSIYFFDPNGHRLELVANSQTQEQIDELRRVAPEMLEEWSRAKKSPQHIDSVTIVGAEHLTKQYARACSYFKTKYTRLDGQKASLAGLASIFNLDISLDSHGTN